MATERVYQRDKHGYPVGSDRIMRETYGPIPEATEFYHGRWGYEIPHDIVGWVWRPDYGSWGALVQFSDGWYGVTNPKPSQS